MEQYGRRTSPGVGVSRTPTQLTCSGNHYRCLHSHVSRRCTRPCCACRCLRWVRTATSTTSLHLRPTTPTTPTTRHPTTLRRPHNTTVAALHLLPLFRHPMTHCWEWATISSPLTTLCCNSLGWTLMSREAADEGEEVGAECMVWIWAWRRTTAEAATDISSTSSTAATSTCNRRRPHTTHNRRRHNLTRVNRLRPNNNSSNNNAVLRATDRCHPTCSSNSNNLRPHRLAECERAAATCR